MAHGLGDDLLSSRISGALLETTMDHRGTLNTEIAEIINDFLICIMLIWANTSTGREVVYSRRVVVNECELSLADRMDTRQGACSQGLNHMILETYQHYPPRQGSTHSFFFDGVNIRPHD